MSEIQSDREGVSRRSVLLGLGAAAGAAAAVTALPTTASAAGTSPSGARLPAVPQAIGQLFAGLTYVGVDAQQFFPEGNPSNRLYENSTGTKLVSSGTLHAGLPVPAGSVLFQVNSGYQGTPVLTIYKRTLQQPQNSTGPQQIFLQTVEAGPGGPFSSTINLPTPIVIDADSTYTISYFVSPGQAIFGCTIGYLPPTQGFVPFEGSTPRVLDTRQPGPLSGKLQPGEERVIDLDAPGARSAVINLTVTETVGRRLCGRVHERHPVAGQLEHQLEFDESEPRQRRGHRLRPRGAYQDSRRRQPDPRRDRPHRLHGLTQRHVSSEAPRSPARRSAAPARGRAGGRSRTRCERCRARARWRTRSSHCSDAASDSGRSPATVTQLAIDAGSRPPPRRRHRRSPACASSRRRSRRTCSTCRRSGRRSAGRPARPGADADRRHDVGSRRGGGVVDREVRRRGTSGARSVHISRQICDDLLELAQPHRGRRELVAVRAVLVLAPSTADAEHEPPAGEHLQRRRHLGGQRRVAIAVAEHVMAQHHVGELGGQPRERRPALEEAFRLLLVEAVEVVGDPHRVEVRQRRGEDVALLVHHDRLEVASRVAGDRRQPSEFHHGAILAWRLRIPHISVTVRRVRGRLGSMRVLACVGMLAAGCGGGDDDTAVDGSGRADNGERARHDGRDSRLDVRVDVDIRGGGDDAAAADRGSDRRDRGARWPGLARRRRTRRVGQERQRIGGADRSGNQRDRRHRGRRRRR